MNEKQKANSAKIWLSIIIIIYLYSIYENLLIIIKNYQNQVFDIIIYLFPFLLLGIFILYRFIYLFSNYLKKTNSEVNSEFKEMRRKNLEFQANMPTNIFKYIKYNKNKPNSTNFLFFGNGVLNLFFIIIFIGFLIYNSNSNEEIIKNLSIVAITLIIYFPLIVFMSKNTAKNQLKFDEKLEEKQKKGIKPGIMDELTWKSLLLILIIGPLIAVGIIIIFALFFDIFA